jgi:hypothetical protein
LNLEDAVQLARDGRLYASLILHGGSPEKRREAALHLARTALCEETATDRPCGTCRNCRRIQWPGESEAFHPDFLVLERDLKTSTSVAATRVFAQAAQVAPYEARGQVFVVANAESLTGEAANALLKVLEEPSVRAPRHFLLLAPSQFDLLPTLRSRSWTLYLGPAEGVDREQADALSARIAAAAHLLSDTGSGAYLSALAGALVAGGDWTDPRDSRCWSLASAATLRAADDLTESALRAALTKLSQALLEAAPLRLRGIAADRILEGLVARELGDFVQDA